MAYSKTFYLQSGGVAYNLDVGFVSDRVDVINHTKYETDASEVEHHWNKQMTDGYALSEVAEDDGMNRAINTSNGFTPYNTSAFTDNQDAIAGASQANPCVITATAHGFGDAGDVVKVRIKNVVGMTELNGNIYKSTIVDANSFSLQTLQGDNVDSTGYSAYSSAGDAYALDLVVDNLGYDGITLGTAVIGVNSDWIEVTCYQDDQFINLGDIA
jgi:hypothetical protein